MDYGTRIKLALLSHRFGLAAFLLPFFIRTVPEIIVGPYPVGFDPIAFYIPITLDWSSRGAAPLTVLGTAPLLFFFSVPVYSLTRLNPVWIFKVLGPFLYGSMIWALYRFLKVGLAWTEKNALLGGLFTSMYFVTLRIGWDLLRTMLALTFVLLLLPLLARKRPNDRSLMQASLLVLTVLSDQLTGILALSILGLVIIWDLLQGNSKQARRSTPQFLIGSMALSVVAYSFFLYPSTYFPLPTFSQTVLGLPSSALFVPYAFLPLSPFLLVGAGRGITREIKLWILICASLAFVATIPLPFFRETSYRWSILMDTPLCIIAFTGVEKVLVSVDQLSKVRLLRAVVRIGLPASFISLAVLYMALPANIAMPYYTQFPDFVPTSMTQNTVPSYDMENLVQSLNWVANQSRSGTALITHQAIYGWARAYFPYPNEIVDYYFGTPLQGVVLAKSLGFSTIYMIWWIEGAGWYGMPRVPSGFVSVHIEGNIDVYNYIA